MEKNGQRYLNKARTRNDAKSNRQGEAGAGLRVTGNIALAHLAGQRMSGGAMLLAGMDAPALGAIRTAEENPAVRLMLELYESPKMRLAREVNKMRRLVGES